MPILVCPLSQVSTVARARAPGRVVSLLDPQTRFPALAEHDDASHLKLEVHDIPEPVEALKAPCETVVGRIVAFVSEWDRTAPLLVHCYAGISRSTATAFVAACVHNPRTDEEEIAWALRRASATATPNPRIVALADAALGRGGRMSKAVAAIGRGVPGWPEIAEAEPFELPSVFARA